MVSYSAPAAAGPAWHAATEVSALKFPTVPSPAWACQGTQRTRFPLYLLNFLHLDVPCSVHVEFLEHAPQKLWVVLEDLKSKKGTRGGTHLRVTLESSALLNDRQGRTRVTARERTNWVCNHGPKYRCILAHV